MLNRVCIMGRFTADPELKQTTCGTVTNFSLAVERDFKTKDGEKIADFIPCVAWNGTADFVCKYFQKGSMAAVSGYLQSNRYEKDGEKRMAWNVHVDKVYFADSKKKDESSGFMPVGPEEYEDCQF